MPFPWFKGFTRCVILGMIDVCIFTCDFAGGIGGVHRGASESFDVSADLTELGRTPVAVISSGVILLKFQQQALFTSFLFALFSVF